MSPRPRILIVDDVYGRADGERNRDRELFCARLGVRDTAGAPAASQVDDPIADAVLISGQVRVGARLENDLEGVLTCVRNGWREWPRWALILLDLHFQSGPIDPGTGEATGEPSDRDPGTYFGLALLDRLLSDTSLGDLPIVIISSMERGPIEARFARAGVHAFVAKDTLDRARLDALLWEHGYLEDDRIVGRSLPLLRALREARRVSRTPGANILVLGETGTGKELLAEYIHRASGRPGPFRRLFVRAHDDLFAADLFGYVKGAFTGAVRDRPGEAELADHGTLLFDEFGDIPVGAQDKLMRLLDVHLRETQRLGESQARRLDLQVVMATNRFDILERGFRRDLLQRANAAHPIVLPPLRERTGDVPLLVELFLRHHEEDLGAERRSVAPEAMDWLVSHPWPGNVRELEQELVEAIASYRNIRYLSPEHLRSGPRMPHPAAAPGPAPTPVPAAVGGRRPDRLTLQDLIQDLDRVEFGMDDRDGWLGRLGDLQAGHARMVARCLDAALVASALATGQPRPTTAMRMLLGRGALRTSEAASAIKRLLSISRPAIADLLADETLHLGRTLHWAENLRGSSTRTTGQQPEEAAPSDDNDAP